MSTAPRSSDRVSTRYRLTPPRIACPDCLADAPAYRWQITADSARCPHCSTDRPFHAVDVVSW